MPEYVADDRPDECTRTIQTGSLRLSFHWGGDRWRHELSVRSGNEWLRVAYSAEIGAWRENPGQVVSPAYQQFHYQTGEGRAFALLVGQSGPHHFSASFEVEGGETTSRVQVDVADRVRAEDPSLACTYAVMTPPATLMDDSVYRVEWDVTGAGRLILSQAGPPDRPARVVVGPPDLPYLPASIWQSLGDLSLTPLQIVEDPDPGAPSLRCRYHWTFETPEVRRSQTTEGRSRPAAQNPIQPREDPR